MAKFHWKKTAAERFWEKVTKTKKCWNFRVSGSRQYGTIWDDGQYVASRYSWKIHFGDIPQGLLVLHKCDNPCCVRPDHLFLGTEKDNTADMFKKGRNRSNPVKGDACIRRKIGSKDVIAIRRSKSRPIDLQRKYNLSETQIYRIRHKKSWTHLK